MSTTANYGWRTPNNDNKVRAGALAIRLLGQDADATVYEINEVVDDLSGSVSSLADAVAALPPAVTLGEVIALGG